MSGNERQPVARQNLEEAHGKDSKREKVAKASTAAHVWLVEKRNETARGQNTELTVLETCLTRFAHGAGTRNRKRGKNRNESRRKAKRTKGPKLTFHAKMTSTGPTGVLRMNRSKPFSASPGVSFSASSLAFNKNSARLMAVEISLPVYAIGRPICSVSSRASSSVRPASASSALRTMIWRSLSLVVRHVLNALAAVSGSSARSACEMPLRVTIGSFVVGEMVVMTSTDMMAGSGMGRNEVGQCVFVELKD